MTRHRNRVFAALSAMMMAGFAAPAGAAPDVDIVGLRLGMTIEEAEAAIKRFNPDLAIETLQVHMQYSDGVDTHQTDPYIRVMRAATPKQDVRVTITFSAPPTGGRALAIERYQRKIANPPFQAAYRDAVIEKYGPPAAETATDSGARARLEMQWNVPDGKAQCVMPSSGQEVSNMSVTLTDSVLGKILDPSGNLRNPLARDISDCAVLLRYSLFQDPVDAASGRMIDIAAAAQNERDVDAWIAQLVEDARQKREGDAEVPQL